MRSLILITMFCGSLAGAAAAQVVSKEKPCRFYPGEVLGKKSLVMNRRLAVDLEMTISTGDGEGDRKMEMTEPIEELCELRITPSRRGWSLAYGERVRHADVPFFGKKTITSPVNGQSYGLRGKEGSRSVVKKGDEAAPAKEVAMILADLAPLLPESPFRRFLLGRSFLPDQEVVLDDAAAKAVLGAFSDDFPGMEVTRASISYCRPVRRGDDECALFHIHGDLRCIRELDGSDIETKGPFRGTMIIVRKGARVRDLNLRAELEMRYDTVNEEGMKGSVRGTGKLEFERRLRD